MRLPGPGPRPALRPVACCPSRSRALSVRGRANELLLLLVLGIYPGAQRPLDAPAEAPRITAVRLSEPGVHRADAEGRGVNEETRVGEGTERSRALGGNVNSEVERCQLRTEML